MPTLPMDSSTAIHTDYSNNKTEVSAFNKTGFSNILSQFHSESNLKVKAT